MTQAEIISERFPHVVSAVFHDAGRARDAANALAAKAGFDSDQIVLVRPHDRELSSKVERESGAIFSTILRSHAVLGIVGAVAGLILAGVLVGAGFDWATTTPGWVFGVFAVVGGAIGMLGGGLVSIRPDHERVITDTEDASEHGKWTVVVHARDEDEKRRADELLEHYSKKVAESL
ncbi:hypothetical protein ABGV17_07880 [Guyparkeria sp. GHLCS8-2]|uniref:hypothetical protein n=1 Tax=Guyparkeria halopsychrophila TaxID=3139421 RepID=UPI0037C840EA